LIVVKHSYISPRGKLRKGGNLNAARVVAIGTALGHIKYIQHRSGEDREKGGREFFTDEQDSADAGELRKEIRDHAGNGVIVHKLMLSPEVNPADPKAFTREVMKNIGDEKGLDLRWYATVHTNTDNHHVHMVVLSRDKNGREVRFGKRDYELLREYGDRYLERHHPLELAAAKSERESKERQRLEDRQKTYEKERQERIREGLELPWLHRKIVREQLEPYQQWQKQKLEDELAERMRKGTNDALEAPLHEDTFTAAGRDWSRADKIEDLRRLNEYLWENPAEWIPRDDYKKLVLWMKEKEAAQRQADKKPEPEQKPETFEYHGERYSKSDSYEKLAGLKKELRDSHERLPIEHYQQLREWIELRDRERFSGELQRQLDASKQRQSADESARNQPGANRYVDPLQAQFMKNPIIGLFMTEASIANELVRSIVLDDRNRDYDKEARDRMEDAKKDVEERRRGRGTEDEKAQDDEAIENIEQAIEEQEEEKQKRQKEREKDRDKRDKDSDFLG
jgi:hypothetical protein